MCVSCGCGDMNNDHGDKRNITMNDIQAAGQAAQCSPQQVGQNIQNSVQGQGMGGSMGSRQMGSQQPGTQQSGY